MSSDGCAGAVNHGGSAGVVGGSGVVGLVASGGVVGAAEWGEVADWNGYRVKQKIHTKHHNLITFWINHVIIII